jgi:hypothetical protein
MIEGRGCKYHNVTEWCQTERTETIFKCLVTLLSRPARVRLEKGSPTFAGWTRGNAGALEREVPATASPSQNSKEDANWDVRKTCTATFKYLDGHGNFTMLW